MTTHYDLAIREASRAEWLPGGAEAAATAWYRAPVSRINAALRGHPNAWLEMRVPCVVLRAVMRYRARAIAAEATAAFYLGTLDVLTRGHERLRADSDAAEAEVTRLRRVINEAWEIANRKAGR